MHHRPIVIRAFLFIILCGLCLCLRPVIAAGDDAAPIVDSQATWQISVLDSAGNVGYFTSTAVDKNNKVHISYTDDTNHVVKYATNVTGAWTTSTIRSANGLQNTAIGVDSTGKVYIAYLNSTSANIAIRDVAGNWTTTSAGFHYPLANGISLAIDRNDIVHIAAPSVQRQQYGPDTYRMEYANNSTGEFKVAKYLPTCMTGAITLRSPSVAIDAGNNVFVAFNVSDALVSATNKSGDWACSYVLMSGAQPVYYSNRYLAIKSSGQPVVAVIGGTEFMALALDAQDKSHIVGHQNACLRYFTDAGGSQQAAYLDCTSAEVGEYGSIAADSQGGIHIAYFDRTNGDLKYATQGLAPPSHKVYLPLLVKQALLPSATPTATLTPTATTETAATATSTPTATSTATATATVSPTSSATPTPTATIGKSGIYNGDFEITDWQGAVGWTGYSKNGWSVFFAQYAAGVRPHSGDVAVWLGGSDNEMNYVQQTNVVVPVDAHILGYWLWFASAETTCGHDFGKVLIDGAVVAQYDLCSATNSGAWVKRTVDLAAYAGKTITVQIRGETNGTVNSNLFIDDVIFQDSLTVARTHGGVQAAEETVRPKSYFVR